MLFLWRKKYSLENYYYMGKSVFFFKEKGILNFSNPPFTVEVKKKRHNFNSLDKKNA